MSVPSFHDRGLEFQKLMTGDNSWCFEYNPAKSNIVHSGWENICQICKSCSSKNLAWRKCTSFCNAGSIVHEEFIPEGQVINVTFYRVVMKLYLKRMKWVTLVLHQSKDWSLLHDNKPLHKTKIVKEFLTNRKVPVLASSSTLLAWPRPNRLYFLPETPTGLKILVLPVHNGN